jgi:hypothetical protein
MDQAALVHATTPPLTRLQPPRRQRPQHRQLLRQPLKPAGIELLLHAVQQAAVLVPIREIPTAAQQQRLVHGLLEPPVPLLDVAVLVRVVGLDLLADQPVMIEQSLIAPRELFALRQVVHRRAQPVRSMPPRHAAQLSQGVLQPLAQALEALRKTDRQRLPIRVGQHEVVDQVLEPLPRDGHVQLVHPREVRRRQPARLVHLAEEHFLGRPRQRPPTPHLPLQRPQLPVGETARIATPQLGEDRLGLQARLPLEQRTNLHPHLGERIDPRRPIVRQSHLARQLPQPPILPSRLVVHVRPRRRDTQPLAGRQQPSQLPHLFVRDHRKPPCVRDLRIVYRRTAEQRPAVAGREF